MPIPTRLSRRQLIDLKASICRQVAERLRPDPELLTADDAEDVSMIVTGLYNTEDREGVRVCFDDSTAPDEVVIPWPGGVEAYSRPGLVEALVEAINQKIRERSEAP